MTRALRRLSRLFLLAFAVIAAGLGYWGLVSQDALTTRQDNPRRVLAEESIRQGQIVDRDGAVLVESLPDGSGQGTYTRHTLYPEAAPAVGYYSLQHGTGGIQASFETTLHGDRYISPVQGWINGLLHRPQVGGDVRLTLSLPLQQATRKALQGRRGAIVLISAATGDILAIDSLPTYDPNTLDREWDTLRADPAAPLINRATQALYQPGGVLQGVVLGEAINSRAINPGSTWSGPAAAEVARASLPCAASHNFTQPTYTEAFAWGCPGPFLTLGQMLGAENLQTGFSDFGLGEAPQFDLPVAALNTQGLSAGDNPAIAAIGQGQLTVTPLHMALVASAFANHGQMPAPRLVSAIRPPGEDWGDVPASATQRGTISTASADTIKTLMQIAVDSGAAQEAKSPQRQVYGHAGLALSGPGPAFNTWFIGFTYTDSHEPIAIAILIEGSADTAGAARIGGQLLADAAALAGK